MEDRFEYLMNEDDLFDAMDAIIGTEDYESGGSIRFAIGTIERQIGKEPFHKILGERKRKVAFCSNCPEILERWENFCPICGQAIDWGSEA